MNANPWLLGLRRPVLALLFITVALSCSDGFAAGPYYTGAYAMTGDGGCGGASGMGLNPTGGCTPGVDALVHSEAFVNGSRGTSNYSQGIADLATGSLVARSIFPDGSANAPNGAANLTDTFTVTGVLSGDVTVMVSMIVDSFITGGASFDDGFGNLSASLGTANWEGTFYSSYLRDGTTTGTDHFVLTRSVTVNDANRVFRVDALLQVSGGGIPGTHDSDASALVQLSLPDGLSFTSASGVFASPVPEPETYAMLLAGLGLLGFAARRRKQKEVAAV